MPDVTYRGEWFSASGRKRRRLPADFVIRSTIQGISTTFPVLLRASM